MSFKDFAALALVATIATPTSAWAMTGVGGCNGLPEYYRALGVLQGMPSACAMTLEEARRIVGASGGPASVVQPVAPAGRAHARRHPRKPQL